MKPCLAVLLVLLASVVQADDKFRNALNSTVRITRSTQGGGWFPSGSGISGSGTMIGESDGKIVVLSNSHVVGPVGGTVIVEAFRDGERIGTYKAKVEKSVKVGWSDVGVVTFDKPKEKLAITPLAETNRIPKVGEEIVTVGCDGGRTPEPAPSPSWASYRHHIQR